MSHTTDDLIARVKLWGMLPSSQDTFLESDFTQILNDEMTMTVVPFIKNIREEYFIEYTDYPIVQNQFEYDIPPNSVGMSLREVVIVDASGNEYKIPRYSLQDRMSTIRSSSVYNDTAGGYYLIKNKVHLKSTTLYSNQTLRMYYYRRPDLLVTQANGARITAISGSPGAYTITVNAVPSSWVTSATDYDIGSGSLPYDSIDRDVSLTITGTSFAYNSTLTDGMAVGNWITLPGTTVNAQLPLEASDLLCQAAVLRCLEALGQGEENSSAIQKYKQIEKNLINIMSPRVDGDSIPFKGNPYIWASQ